ncbi:MAG TPA: polysaccharide biosynthesis tyrosine autokinase [Chthonomonadales bacterium]|nr:polysaccharide biosynthesis tyrosine autokinase [Chthonomonadales bacterium]
MEYVREATASDVSFRTVVGIAWRRKWVILVVLAFVMGATVQLTRRQPQMWRANAQMMIIHRAGPLAASPEHGLTNPLMETTSTQLALLRSDTMAGRTLAWLKNDAFERGKAADELGMVEDQSIWRNFQRNVRVSSPEGTNIINVEVSLNHPERARALADAVCNAFVQWKLELARQSVEDIRRQLQGRAEQAGRQLQDAEQVVARMKRAGAAVEVTAHDQAAVERYVEQAAQMAATRQAVAVQQSRLRDLEGRMGQVRATVRQGELGDDGQVSQLQQQLGLLETERARLGVRFGPQHPEMRVVDAQILDVKGRLARAIQSSFDARRPTVQAAAALYEEYKQAQTMLSFRQAELAAAAQMRSEFRRDAARVPDATLAYAKAERDAQLARNLYSSAQGSLNAVELSRDIAAGNVQVSSQAITPLDPFQPDWARSLTLGLVVALSLAALAALGIEQADRRVRTAHDIRRLIPGPIIGRLPELPRPDARALAGMEAPPLALEVYGMARASLAMAVRASGVEEPWRRHVVMVTSAVPGEGKSVTAAQMARSLARSGRSVLLVDADLRRPTQNRLFRTAEPVGLAEVLTGAMTLDEAVVASDTEGLVILHSGQATGNPTEMIARREMREIVEAMRNRADVTIIDVPACAVVADALLIAPYVDSILHVVGMGMVDEETMERTLAALHAAAPKTLAFFLNRTSRERAHSYGGRYYYRYGEYAGTNGTAAATPMLEGTARESDGSAAGSSRQS